jgi:hypothetical protein
MPRLSLKDLTVDPPHLIALVRMFLIARCNRPVSSPVTSAAGQRGWTLARWRLSST